MLLQQSEDLSMWLPLQCPVVVLALQGQHKAVMDVFPGLEI